MSIRDTDTTTTNPYEGVLPLWAYKVSLAYAKRLGYRQDQIDDALQEIAIKYSAFRFDHTRDTGASERTAQIALIRNTLLQIRRNQIRYAQRLEQMQAEPRQPEAGPDTVAQHELWQVVQGLPTADRNVCLLLAEGRSVHAVAKELKLGWTTVTDTMRRIRAHFTEAGIDGGMLG